MTFFVIMSNFLPLTSQWTQIYQNDNNYFGYFQGMSFIDVSTGIVACQDSALVKTTNGGNNWYPIHGTENHGLRVIELTSANTGYAIGNIGFSNGQFLKTTNTGNNWSIQSLPYYIFYMDFIDDNNGYISDDNGFIHKTTNGGQNWMNFNLATGQLNYVEFINVNTGFVVASSNQRLFTTTNGGLNWQEKLSPVFTKIQFLNYNTGFGYVNLYQSTLYKTMNNGDNWYNIFQMDSVFIVDVNFINVNTGWLTGGKLFNNYAYQRKIFKTTNAGLNWIEQFTGNVSLDSSSCLGVIQMLDSVNGYVSTVHCEVVGQSPTNRGRIYKTTNGGGGPIGIEPVYTNIPENYKLHQNYPNPFNPVTMISFEIPLVGSNSSTSLIIYDITGKEVSELVNEQLQPGKYEISWNAANFTSGVYFYTLISGIFKETRKMLLIK